VLLALTEALFPKGGALWSLAGVHARLRLRLGLRPRSLDSGRLYMSALDAGQCWSPSGRCWRLLRLEWVFATPKRCLSVSAKNGFVGSYGRARLYRLAASTPLGAPRAAELVITEYAHGIVSLGVVSYKIKRAYVWARKGTPRDLFV
jgi:hypothetical protein